MKLKTVGYKGFEIEVYVYESGVFWVYTLNKGASSNKMDEAIKMAKGIIDAFICEDIVDFDMLVAKTLSLVKCTEGGDVDCIDEAGFKIILDSYINHKKLGSR